MTFVILLFFQTYYAVIPAKAGMTAVVLIIMTAVVLLIKIVIDNNLYE